MKLNEEPNLPGGGVLVIRLTDLLRSILRQLNAVTAKAEAPEITGSALNMTIQPLAPTAAQDGGTISVVGRSASAGFNGGPVELTSGNGDNGGELRITSGTGVNIGGDLLLSAGGASGPGGTGGSFLLTGGSASGGGGSAGGSFYMQAGGGDTTGSVFLITPIGAGIEVTDDGAAVKVGLWGATPTAQATTAIAGAAFVAGAGTAVNSNSTFGGYTLAQIAAALKAIGALQ